MHELARQDISDFIVKYLGSAHLKRPQPVLDMGSFDVNGNVRDLFEKRGYKYIGMDLREGPNVDVVLEWPDAFPFETNYFDAVVCNSVLEHDPQFWVTFKEMVRVCRPTGFVYVAVPSQGSIHRYPKDYWRFLPDAWEALGEWGNAKIIEHYINQKTGRKNNICIFGFHR